MGIFVSILTMEETMKWFCLHINDQWSFTHGFSIYLSQGRTSFAFSGHWVKIFKWQKIQKEITESQTSFCKASMAKAGQILKPAAHNGVMQQASGPAAVIP